MKALPGSILANGMITIAGGGATDRGPIFITYRRAKVAERFGWRRSAWGERPDEELVAVYR
jgi:hypothetical protein